MMATLMLPMTLSALMAARQPGEAPSVHSARVSGAAVTTLAGNALFGPTRSGGAAASFSLTLGAYSERGAVTFSRVSALRPRPGRYAIAPMGPGMRGEAFHALVSLGGPEAPVGVFRAVSGAITITRSDEGKVEGSYELKAVGFLASDPMREDREITVRGGFLAEPAALASSYEASFAGQTAGLARGSAEFGELETDGVRTFSLALGAHSEQGAVILTRQGAGRPTVGVYDVREADPATSEFHGLVITGGPASPTGVYRVLRGTLTITESSAERVVGNFQLWAEGFTASDPETETRPLSAAGTFVATTGAATALSFR